jgi:nucleotide-binding universal stress UspA family protein
MTLADVLEEMPPAVRRFVPKGWNLQVLARAEKRDGLERSAASMRRFGVKPRLALLDGSPAKALVDEVVRGRHDLLVMDAPWFDDAPPDRMTATRVARECPCPVLFAYEPRRRPPRVLVAIDVGPWPGRATDQLNLALMRVAIRFIEALGGELHVLHVWEPYGESLMRRGGLSDSEMRQYVLDSRAGVRDDLERAVAPFRHWIAPAHVHLERGDPRRVIAAFAKRHRIDLIVIGTVERRGLSGRVIGNTGETILTKAPCSVVLVGPRWPVSSRRRG